MGERKQPQEEPGTAPAPRTLTVSHARRGWQTSPGPKAPTAAIQLGLPRSSRGRTAQGSWNLANSQTPASAGTLPMLPCSCGGNEGPMGAGSLLAPTGPHLHSAMNTDHGVQTPHPSGVAREGSGIPGPQGELGGQKCGLRPRGPRRPEQDLIQLPGPRGHNAQRDSHMRASTPFFLGIAGLTVPLPAQPSTAHLSLSGGLPRNPGPAKSLRLLGPRTPHLSNTHHSSRCLFSLLPECYAGAPGGPRPTEEGTACPPCPHPPPWVTPADHFPSIKQHRAWRETVHSQVGSAALGQGPRRAVEWKERTPVSTLEAGLGCRPT